MKNSLKGRKCIELKCALCENSFQKAKNEYDRRIRNGISNFFCSRKCSGKDSVARTIGPFSGKFSIRNLGNPRNRIDELTPFRRFLRSSKNRSLNREYECTISVKEIKEIWDKQNGKCYYTKIPMILKKMSGPEQASLDRIDSSKGYIKENIVFSCVAINYAKNKFSEKDIKEFISKINLGYGLHK